MIIVVAAIGWWCYRHGYLMALDDENSLVEDTINSTLIELAKNGYLKHSYNESGVLQIHALEGNDYGSNDESEKEG